MILVAATSLWVSIALVAVMAYIFRPKRVRPYSNAPFLTISLLEKLQNLWGMTALVQRGYSKYNQGTFQYTTIRGRRQVLGCSDALIAEIKNASDENLSFAAWTQEFHQMDTVFPDYSGGVDMVRWPSFAKLSYRWFKNTLTKDLAETFPQMKKDLMDGWNPEYLAAMKDPMYNVSRNCVIGAIGRYVHMCVR
ncbi:hypothetical protein BDD12DRAFT_829113 [Trichophaea hybrida]|nr:hypothetical protein BDD12DRAFT_829113 [Trichophaea hybrida]